MNEYFNICFRWVRNVHQKLKWNMQKNLNKVAAVLCLLLHKSWIKKLFSKCFSFSNLEKMVWIFSLINERKWIKRRAKENLLFVHFSDSTMKLIIVIYYCCFCNLINMLTASLSSHVKQMNCIGFTYFFEFWYRNWMFFRPEKGVIFGRSADFCHWLSAELEIFSWAFKPTEIDIIIMFHKHKYVLNVQMRKCFWKQRNWNIERNNKELYDF